MGKRWMKGCKRGGEWGEKEKRFVKNGTPF